MKSYAIEPPIAEDPARATRALADAVEHLAGLRLKFGGVSIARGMFVLTIEGEFPSRQEAHLRLKAE